MCTTKKVVPEVPGVPGVSVCPSFTLFPLLVSVLLPVLLALLCKLLLLSKDWLAVHAEGAVDHRVRQRSLPLCWCARRVNIRQAVNADEQNKRAELNKSPTRRWRDEANRLYNSSATHPTRLERT
jgi:hypothetical protein